ncbi:MAG TPA: hypothetical protein VFE33_03210 [Thermoanaerobaculia bacterium]|nr:hypothetical protein [Thermoanaerobaculia bacterium]
MKIFVGWAYEATWVEDFALPLIRSYGIEVVTGKEVQGQVITSSVKDLIAAADATLFFTTRKISNQDATWTTSDWVVDEIKHAESLKKPIVLEVREDGVDYPNKINEQRQHVKMNPADRLGALVDLALTVSRWRRISFKIKLLPDKFVEILRLRVHSGRYECFYQLRHAGRLVYGPTKAEIVREGLELFVYAYDLPADYIAQSDTFLEVTVNVSGDQWISTGIRLGALEVMMEKLE